jgi:4-amino-4-deoxychorismate lyase
VLWINGKPINGKDNILDDGFWFGRGVFETIRVHETPLFWEEHIARLNNGLAALQIRPAIDQREMLVQVTDLAIRQCVLKIAVTPDNSFLQTRPLPSHTIGPFRLLPVENQRTTNPLLLSCKSINYLENLLAHEQAAREGFDDALFIGAAGSLSETSRANLFFLSNGRILTPDLDCGLLDGVIRRWVLANFAVETGCFDLAELLAADAVFVTNSVIGIQPVAAIGDQSYGDSSVVREIRRDYLEQVGFAK